MAKSKQSLGGKARAKKLNDAERTAIASTAAKARWEKESSSNIPKATHPGDLKIGDIVIPCAVLDDGRRFVDQINRVMIHKPITPSGFPNPSGIHTDTRFSGQGPI